MLKITMHNLIIYVTKNMYSFYYFLMQPFKMTSWRIFSKNSILLIVMKFVEIEINCLRVKC